MLPIPPYLVSKSFAAVPRTQVPFPTEINCHGSRHCVMRINNSWQSSLFLVCPSLYPGSWGVPKKALVARTRSDYTVCWFWDVALVLPAFSWFLRDPAYLEPFTAGSKWALQVLLMGRQEVTFLGYISSVEMWNNWIYPQTPAYLSFWLRPALSEQRGDKFSLCWWKSNCASPANHVVQLLAFGAICFHDPSDLLSLTS